MPAEGVCAPAQFPWLAVALLLLNNETATR
jgi:hypothetical protein